jgi:hypothetical protein
MGEEIPVVCGVLEANQNTVGAKKKAPVITTANPTTSAFVLRLT